MYDVVYMKRTNIYLDENQYKKILKVAEGKSTTVSALIRQLIDQSLEHSYEYESSRALASLLVKMGKNAVKPRKGSPNITSENFRDYLYGKHSKYAKKWSK